MRKRPAKPASDPNVAAFRVVERLTGDGPTKNPPRKPVPPKKKRAQKT